ICVEFVAMLRLSTSWTLLPYTTLFRSRSRPAASRAVNANEPTSRWRSRIVERSRVEERLEPFVDPARVVPIWHPQAARPRASVRSEEHTSELQSRENLVCRLLLETKTI